MFLQVNIIRHYWCIGLAKKLFEMYNLWAKPLCKKLFVCVCVCMHAYVWEYDKEVGQKAEPPCFRFLLVEIFAAYYHCRY